jgi:hypothetical protein
MKTKLNQADEQKKIDFEIYIFRRRMFKMNKELKYYRVTGVDITYSEQVMAPVDLHWQFWKPLQRMYKEWRMKQVNAKNQEA